MKPDTISLQEIIGDIKQSELLKSLSDETIMDWAIEFHRILGLAETFEEKIAVLEIEDYRAALPDDFYEVIQVRSFQNNQQRPIYFRSMTDHFYKSENKLNSVPYTYVIRGKVIYVSPMKRTRIEVAYRAMELDDCGFILIPDNEKYKRALKSYIKVKRFKDLYETGKLREDVLERAERDYAFDVGAASNDFKMPSFDEIESVGNIINSLLPRRFSHYRGYADSGSKEFKKIH